MLAKIIVTKTTDPKYRQEREFDQEIITIGREPSNAIFLEDPAKIISRQHAQLKRDSDKFILIDAGSRNSTIVNNKSLEPNDTCDLSDGDRIKVGDYIIEYSAIAAASDQTVIYVNPFREQANHIARLMKEIQEKYDGENEAIRKDTLQQALKEAFLLNGVENASINKAFAEELVPASDDEPAAPPKPAEAAAAPVAFSGDNSMISEIGVDVGLMGRVNQNLELLMDGMITLFKKAVEFRDQFVGIAMVETQTPLNTATPDQLKEFLFSDRISEEEAQKRFRVIKRQVDDIVLHQTAQVNGYRALIDKGVPNLLQYLNPENLEKHFAKQKVSFGLFSVPMSMVPFMVKSKAMNTYRQMIQELLDEGRVAYERRIFRPSFVDAYMKTLADSDPAYSEMLQL
ncbi:MAG: FHA domain-containing protein [Calditrichia bacterium]